MRLSRRASNERRRFVIGCTSSRLPFWVFKIKENALVSCVAARIIKGHPSRWEICDTRLLKLNARAAYYVALRPQVFLFVVAGKESRQKASSTLERCDQQMNELKISTWAAYFFKYFETRVGVWNDKSVEATCAPAFRGWLGCDQVRTGRSIYKASLRRHREQPVLNHEEPQQQSEPPKNLVVANLRRRPGELLNEPVRSSVSQRQSEECSQTKTNLIA